MNNENSSNEHTTLMNAFVTELLCKQAGVMHKNTTEQVLYKILTESGITEIAQLSEELCYLRK